MALLTLEGFARWRMVGLLPKRDSSPYASFFGCGKEPSTKTNETYRIIAFGGSTTLGSLNTCQGEYPYYVEQMLQGHFGRNSVEVFNSGNNSVTTLGALKRIQVLLPVLKPDLIIVHSVINHFANYAYRVPGINIKTEGETIEIVANPVHISRSNYLEIVNFYLMKHSYFYRWFREFIGAHLYNDAGMAYKSMPREGLYRINVSGWTSVESENINTLLDEPVRKYEALLREILRTARDHGAHVVLIKPPIIKASFHGWFGDAISLKANSLDEAQKKAKRLLQNFEIFLPAYSQALRAIEKVASEYGATVVDATTIFDGSNNRAGFFIDWVHLNANGNKLLGSLIARELISNRLILKLESGRL